MRNTLEKDRPPVSTYEQALMWLVKFWGDDWKLFLAADVLPPEAKLVCDMFWQTEAKLRFDLTKRCKQLDRDSAPAPKRNLWGRMAWS